MKQFKKWFVAPSAVLALFCLFSVPLLAQTFRGGINGSVTDPTGAVVPQAHVTATEIATATVYNTVASSAGEFNFSDLPIGTYKVTVLATGFQTVDFNGISVTAGTVYTLPVKLSLAQQATTVEVAADALTLDTTTNTQTTVLDSKSLQDVPLNGRDFTQLLGTSAAFSGIGNTGSVNGMRNDQINYTIDGTDNNDLYLNADAVNQGGISGIAGVIYPVDALDEYSLQTNGNSESGRSPGGNLNVSTKSGTNEFHGTAYYFNRNEALAVKNPFVGPDAAPSPLRNQNYGGSVGGPIWKDHAFFFIAYEEQKFIIGEANTVTEPSPAYVTEALAVLANPINPATGKGTYGNYAAVTPSQISQNILNTLWDPSVIANLPGTPDNYSSNAPESGYSHNLVVKLDNNFSEKSHLSARWFFGQGYAVAPDCIFACSYLPEYFQTVPSHIQNFDTVWNYVLRPNLSNQLAAGASFFTQGFVDADHTQDVLALTGLDTGSALSGSPQISINGFDSIGITPISGRNDITGQIADTVSWTVGKHQLRFGVEYRRAYIDLYYNFEGLGAFNFGNDGVLGPWAGSSAISDPNVENLADYLAGYSADYSDILGNQERFLYTHTGTAFVEDSWQVAPKLNLNLGIRYDYQQPFYTNSPNLSTFEPNNGGLVVAGAHGSQQYFYNANKLDFSPRIGLSYQLREGTLLRANYGIYFDQPAGQAFLGNIGIPNGGAGGVNNNPAGTEPVESIVKGEPNPLAPIWAINNPPVPIFTAAAGQPTGSNVVSIYSVTPNFKTPYAEIFGLNVEQSLGRSWQVNVGYVGTLSRHNLVLQDINQSAVIPGEQLDQSTATVAVGTNTFSAQQASRPYFSQYPNFGIINQLNSAASASYNGLQITLRSSSWHGLSSQFAYAWSHNLDDSTAFNILPQNSANLKGDWGNSNYDIRNHFSAYLNYAIPGLSHGPRGLTHGWEVNGIAKFQNGEPVNILSGVDNSGTGENEDRASITGPALNSDRSVQTQSSGGLAAQYFNPNSFVTPALGTYGNLGRNQITGPGFGDVDLSLVKTTPIYKDRVRAQFRVEMFNVFNRTNLSPPNNNVGAIGSFGQSTSTIGTSEGAPGIGAGEPYNTQLALKILF
jgi:outer membrane receptor protein involved in Fe transport